MVRCLAFLHQSDILIVMGNRITSAGVHRNVRTSPNSGQTPPTHLYVEYHDVVAYRDNNRNRYVMTVSEHLGTDGPGDGTLCPVLENVIEGVVVYLPTTARWKQEPKLDHIFQTHNIQGRTTEQSRCDIKISERRINGQQDGAIVTEHETRDERGMPSPSKYPFHLSVEAAVWQAIKLDLHRLNGVDLRNIPAALAALQTTQWREAPIVPLQQSLLGPRQ